MRWPWDQHGKPKFYEAEAWLDGYRVGRNVHEGYGESWLSKAWTAVVPGDLRGKTKAEAWNMGHFAGVAAECEYIAASEAKMQELSGRDPHSVTRSIHDV